jgi:hypothetical protein
VAAAVDRHRHVLLPSDVDRGDRVIAAFAPGDQRGTAVDHPVEDVPHLVVGSVAGVDELAAEAGELEAHCGRLPWLRS